MCIYLLQFCNIEIHLIRNVRRRLIWVFVVRMKKLCKLVYPKCAKWRFWSDCANAQSDLTLSWAHISKGTFADVATQLMGSNFFSMNVFYWGILFCVWMSQQIRKEQTPILNCNNRLGTASRKTTGDLNYCDFDIFQKVVFCLALYTEEVNLQTFVMI